VWDRVPSAPLRAGFDPVMPSKARLPLWGSLVQSKALTAKGAKKCRKGREGTCEEYGGSFVRDSLDF